MTYILVCGGYLSCALAAVCVGLYRIQDRLLKQKRIGKLSRRLPSLGTADRCGHLFIQIGVVLTAMGLWAQAREGVIDIAVPEIRLIFVGLVYSTYLGFYGAGWRGIQMQNLRLLGFMALTLGLLYDS